MFYISLNSNLSNVISQIWSHAELQSNSSKSINWSECLFLTFGTGNYGNIIENVCVPTAYFAATSPGRRVILNYGGSELQIYKDSNTTIKVTASNIVTEQTLQVYGLIRK